MKMNNYLNKILTGDCIKVLQEMPAESVDLVVTSPPYNCGIEYNNYNDPRPFDEYYSWCKEWVSLCYKVLKDNRRIALNVLVNMGNRQIGRDLPCVRFSNLLEQVGFNLNNIILWEDETRATLTAWGSWASASAPYIYCPYEAIIIASKGDWKRQDKGISNITGDEFKKWVRGTWRFPPVRNKSFPVSFPEELPRRCIKLLSYVGDIVLDPFCGIGTTCTVAKKLNREYIGIDISPKYCKLARNRLRTFF
jgi:site-specific DNA-methyltransferase (adenine-specific)